MADSDSIIERLEDDNQTDGVNADKREPFVELGLTEEDTDTRVANPRNLVTNSKARGFLSTNQLNLTDNTDIKIALDDYTYNPGKHFDTSNNEFVTPIDGFYIVQASITFINTVTDKSYRTSIYKDGVVFSFSQVHTAQADTISAHHSDILELKKGEKVSIFGQAAAGVSTVDVQGTEASTFMSIHLISARTTV